MSAIIGVLHRDGRPVARRDLAAMAETLARWGSDGTGFWNVGSIGLGHLALRTTPESANERLPLSDATGTAVVTADARIDNRDELITELDLDGRPTVRITDAELILRAYRRWGEACPERLLGDFAFALWDSERQELFCARDPMGVRPFFYHLSRQLFAFGTQIGALRRLQEVPRRLDEVTLAGYLALLPPDRTRTFYREIFKLPPAHCMTISREGSHIRSYWSGDASRRVRLGSDREYAEAFQEIFTAAVQCRLRSSGPVAAMLSGGLDSSAIVCTARRVLPPGECLTTLSAVFPSLRDGESSVDESRFIDAIVAGGGLNARYVRADRASPLFDFLWRGDEPIPAAAMYMDWTILEAASAEGVKVVLSGNDGDTVVSYGHAYLAELAWTGRWRTLLDELYALSRRLGIPRRILMKRYVLSTILPGGIASIWNGLHRNGTHPYDPRSVIHPEFAARTDLHERTRRLMREERPARSARRAHSRNLDSTLLPLLLETFARGCAVFDLEPRYPFFDRRLVEFCLGLPGHQKLNQGWDRAVMRRAMTGLLPHEIQWRPRKQNLGINFNRRLLDGREILEDVVLGDSSVIDDYIDVPALRQRYRRYLENPTRTADSFSVFWAVVIALWLRESGVQP